MKVIVDRIENGIVVLEKEDRSIVEMNKALFPESIKAGDVMVIEYGKGDQDSITVVVLNEETENRRKEIKHRFQRLIKENHKK